MEGARDPDAERNRAHWDALSADYQARHGDELAGARAEAWGVWRIPESELGVLGDVTGLDVLELGCGAAQWGVALARRGARVTGLDQSAEQLRHAAAAARDAAVELALVEASAESVPLPDASFDVVFCDHGAIGWADPLALIPEAARLLRPGGLLAWCWGTPFAETHWPVDAERVGTTLVRDYFGLHRFEDEVDGTVIFMLPHSRTIAALREAGLVVEELIELQPPEGATSTYRPHPDELAWARRWPMEEIWRARKA
ncbi:MAG TPA: class I SAM-dependent methyltransferase [Solirubrobacteraceae bacterium]|nr:class I SAM-dependent methyltransferase [Solirubrobacteraceae bacterium]